MMEKIGLLIISLALAATEFFLFSSDHFFFGYFGAIVVVFLLHTSKKFDPRFTILLTLMVTVLGPFGAGMTAAAIFLYLIYLKTSSSLSDLLTALFPEQEVETSRDLYERVLYSLEDINPKSNTVPFNDIISFGTEKQKRRAIEKILRYFHPKFIPVLRNAITDSHPGIRVLAATAIAALSDQYFQKYLELEKEVKAKGNQESYLKLAKHCARYAESEILDDDRGKKMREIAVQSFEKYLQMVPNDGDILLELGRIHYENQDFEKAKHFLQRAVDSDPTLEACKWYMSVLFELNEYSEIRSFSKEHGSKDFDNPYHEARHLLKLWGEQSQEVCFD